MAIEEKLEMMGQSHKGNKVPYRTILVHKDDAEKLRRLGELLEARHTGVKRGGNMSAGMRFLIRVVLPDILYALEQDTEEAQTWKKELRYLWDSVTPVE